jgi:hypothetical protein
VVLQTFINQFIRVFANQPASNKAIIIAVVNRIASDNEITDNGRIATIIPNLDIYDIT